MAHKRISCMEIRQLIQLKENGESNRSCAELLQMNRNTVNDYVTVLKATENRHCFGHFLHRNF